MSKEWKLVLSTVNLPGDHTGENIADHLKKITHEWIVVVTDNGACFAHAITVPTFVATASTCFADYH